MPISRPIQNSATPAIQPEGGTTSEAHARRRWDPVVKLTHWSIALAVLANAVFTEEGSANHVWVGYALAAILGLRLLWGLIGPAEARFGAFPPSPHRAVAHVGDVLAGRHTQHRSHNPLGALMVYAIWATLLVIIGTGVAMAGLPTNQPTLATVAIEEHDDGAEQEGRGEREEGVAEEVHEVAANLLYGLILLHIGGVIFESRRQRRNLALAMLPGHR
jgi:cytochrome b